MHKKKGGITKKPLFVISTERSEWRDLYNTLIINRYLDYALRASLDMTAFLVSLLFRADGETRTPASRCIAFFVVPQSGMRRTAPRGRERKAKQSSGLFAASSRRQEDTEFES